MNGLAFAHGLYLGGGGGTPPVERPSHRGASAGGLRARTVNTDPILLARPHGAGLRALGRTSRTIEKRLRE